MANSALTFLYVEDDDLSREVMQLMVTEMLGHELILYADSTGFADRIRALPAIPAAIFLDIHIGPHDGYGMLQIIRQEPRFAHVPVIAMTASVMSFDVEKLQNAGFDGLIAKPLRKKQFPMLLDRILNGEQVWFTS